MQWSPHNQGSLIKNMPPWLIPKNYKSKWSWLSSFFVVYFFVFFHLNTGGIDFIIFSVFSQEIRSLSWKESIEQTKPEFTKVKNKTTTTTKQKNQSNGKSTTLHAFLMQLNFQQSSNLFIKQQKIKSVKRNCCHFITEGKELLFFYIGGSYWK